MPRRQLTSRQFQAFQILRYFLKDMYEGIHGPRTWTKSNDRSLKQAILNLTSIEDISYALAHKTAESLEQAVDEQAVPKAGRNLPDVP
jgi:hypothetical protein